MIKMRVVSIRFRSSTHELASASTNPVMENRVGVHLLMAREIWHLFPAIFTSTCTIQKAVRARLESRRATTMSGNYQGRFTGNSIEPHEIRPDLRNFRC